MGRGHGEIRLVAMVELRPWLHLIACSALVAAMLSLGQTRWKTGFSREYIEITLCCTRANVISYQ